MGEFCYLALPKGSINDYHILIIPIDCLPNRLHLSSACKRELNRFIEAIKLFFKETLGMDYLLFERSIRTTNGRDHMQIQMIPFQYQMTKENPIHFLQQKANEFHLSFEELQVISKLFFIALLFLLFHSHTLSY